jgi:hypothetical protein
MDRTNWQLGSININILMIGLVLENGRFIPIYFELLDKKGTADIYLILMSIFQYGMVFKYKIAVLFFAE